MQYVDLYSLNVGDICMEDCRPQIYRVISKEFDEDFDGNMVVLEDVQTGGRDKFGHKGCYGPVMILLTKAV